MTKVYQVAIAIPGLLHVGGIVKADDLHDELWSIRQDFYKALGRDAVTDAYHLIPAIKRLDDLCYELSNKKEKQT